MFVYAVFYALYFALFMILFTLALIFVRKPEKDWLWEKLAAWAIISWMPI